MRCYALSGIGNPKVGDNTARVLVHSPAPLVATRTYVGIGLRRWLYDACLRLFLVGLDVSRRNCNCNVLKTESAVDCLAALRQCCGFSHIGLVVGENLKTPRTSTGNPIRPHW